MLSAFFGELGKRLVDKWLTLLYFPGLLFTGAAGVALTLGQRHWADARHLVSEAGRYSAVVQHKGAAAVLLVGAAALLAAAASGVLAGVGAGVARAAWLGRWPRWASPARDSLTAL